MINYPSEEQLQKLCDEYCLSSWTMDLALEIIDLIKQLNPE